MDAALFKFYDKENCTSIISTSIIYSAKHGGLLTLLLFTIIGGCLGLELIQHTAKEYVNRGIRYRLSGNLDTRDK